MQHERHRVPVTALAFFCWKITFAGEGNYLRAYSADQRLIGSKRIFQNQAIHGIVLDPKPGSPVFVYGGPLLRTLFVKGSEDGDITIAVGTLHHLGDWILDAAFAPAVDDNPRRWASIVTAHNALHVACLDEYPASTSELPPNASIECLVSRSNCILYSAHTSWLSSSQCLIASGTAFGDIIVWSAFTSSSGSRIGVRKQTHYTFSAHDGSIFGIQISPLVTLPGSNKETRITRVLASCSDDRNVKLWDVSHLTTESTTLIDMQRATGFAKSDRKLDVAPPCLARVMGHVSRIWQVRFGTEHTPELRQIQSFGEDASVITWTLHQTATQTALPYALKKLHTVEAHSGKNIWAVAKDEDERLATGGADGALVSYSNVRDVDHLLQLSDSGADSEIADVLRAYYHIGVNTLVATTQQGGIFQLRLDQDSGEQKMTVISNPVNSFRSFSMVAGLPGVCFVAGANGDVYAYVQGGSEVYQVVSGNGKPAGLFTYRYSDGEAALLITTVGASAARLLLMDIECGGQEARTTREVLLHLPPNFIATSVSLLKSGSTLSAILGSRTGSLAVYDVLQAGRSDPVFPFQIHNLVHGKEAITQLHTTTDDDFAGRFWLWSTGRDGTFAVHRISFQNAGLEVSLVHQLCLPFGPNIESLNLSETGRLFVWGFKSKHFIVYDVVAQREVMSVECGGAHRNWDFRPSERGGTFVWTKASKVYRRTQTELPYTIMHAGGHGREIKSTAVSSTYPQIIATGAEDTDIKLHRLEGGKFKCLQTLRRHNTGIQCLQWSADGRYLFSSGGFEEFFIWRVSTGIPYLDVGVVCVSKHPRSGSSDLRIMGFDAQETAEDGEGIDLRRVSIVMAYSDSTAKVWRYKRNTWELVASGDYLTACLTHTIWTNTSDREFLTAATDGHVATWQIDKAERKFSWRDRHQVHQSATHAVATRKLADGSTLLVSGGDDNAIAITRICDRQPAKTLLLPRAHAAAITGVVVLAVDGDTFWLVSASIDQRVKLWQFDVDVSRGGVEGVEVKLLQNAFSAVADVASLDVCTLEDGGVGVLVCGVGMDLWRLPSREGDTKAEPNGR